VRQRVFHLLEAIWVISRANSHRLATSASCNVQQPNFRFIQGNFATAKRFKQVYADLSAFWLPHSYMGHH